MRLLLFSDVHCYEEGARRLVTMAEQADIVIGAGDFGEFREGLDEIMPIFAAIDQPAILVPGNSESFEELTRATECWPSAQVLHGSGTEVEGIPFYGIGGGIPVTPFGSWSWDFSEREAAELLAPCPPGGVLVSHSPPKGTLDLTSSGFSVGSTAVLDCIQAKQPRLVVCGHIHESSGKQEQLGNTPIVNAGPQGIFFDL